MSISVISSGFIDIPYSITFQGAKQGSIAATIKLTYYPAARSAAGSRMGSLVRMSRICAVVTEEKARRVSRPPIFLAKFD
jgi:hypothetical protein